MRWKLAVGLLWALHRVARGKGRLVFAIVAKPAIEEDRVQIALADTTVIPPGPVRELVHSILKAHAGAMMQMLTGTAESPTQIDPSLPARSWQTEA